ncbi:Zip-domain-containing protein [Xylariomycetidae sp. FL2044]|nr:Zip-domain-containing protein [Xylariomycetidae sp. FL2044]
MRRPVLSLSLLVLAFNLVVDLLPGVGATYISSTTRKRHNAPAITSAPTIRPRATESFTAISDCHGHDNEVFCFHGSSEVEVVIAATATSDIAATYTDCHTHGTDSYCVGPNGEDVEVLGVTADESSEDHHDHSEEETASESSGGTKDCHFHAGVEHCVGGDGKDVVECTRQDRDYNIPLRIGLLFVMLATSFIGVAGPIFLAPILPAKLNIVFIVLKQFGTGVIISTAFIHLFTHAQLMLTNECLGEMKYEATTAALLMAGLFLTFVIEHGSHRIARKYWSRSKYGDEVISVMVLEAGIIFHSLLIGLTTVVAGDSYFVTLFVVIVFHQMFEGIALGTRIASVGRHNEDGGSPPETPTEGPKTVPTEESAAAGIIAASDENKPCKSLSTMKKLLMAGAFAIVTPIGMAIGIGVLQYFNGNDPSTLIAIGTLNAVSAGILVWVGVVEMWAGDWMFGGELVDAGATVTTCAGTGLVAGMVLMSFLGKWA